MKCVSVVEGYSSPGLHIRDSEPGKSPHALVTTGYLEAGIKLPLSDALLKRLFDPERLSWFKDTSTELLRCDVDKRADTWLVPETEATREDLLVYVSDHHSCKLTETPLVKITLSETGCRILHGTTDCSARNSSYTYSSKFAGEAMLLVMSAGGWFRVEKHVKTPLKFLSPARLSRGATHSESQHSRYTVDFEKLVQMKRESLK
jgi:hypothetical protein